MRMRSKRARFTAFSSIFALLLFRYVWVCPHAPKMHLPLCMHSTFIQIEPFGLVLYGSSKTRGQPSCLLLCLNNLYVS